MKKIKDKSKMYMILGISFLVLAVLGSTYAYYKYVIATINVDTITRGLDYYINYTKGTDITSAALNPGSDYTSGNNLSVTLYKKDNTYTIYGHIYLDISNISANLSSSGALKYAVLEGTTKIADGELTGASSGNSVPLAVNIPLKTTSTKYTVYLWLDETEENYMSAENTSISATVRCEASMKPIKGTSYGTTGKYFYNKYTPNAKVINNGITYNYDTTNSLMQDIGGNLRFYGASPNNYIYFNCSDYSNQSSSTCEKWRIIGVFEGKVKIMRNEVIGDYSWDNKDTTTGAERDYGKNDWTDARLMKLLNPGYESETTGGSLYYNAKSGNCYSGQNNATTTCDFTSAGIKNDITRNLISDTTYYLGGHTSSSVYPNEIYEKERGTAVYSERPTTWPGKIALPYPSDYGYAADLGKCLNKQLNAYNESTCTSNNWMMSIFTSSYNWLLTPNSGSANFAWYVYSTGFVFSNIVAYSAYGVAPVLYLNPDTIITSGEGTKDSPYKVKYDDSVKGEYFNGTTNYKTLGFTNYNAATISLVARFRIDEYNSGVAYIFGNPEGAGSGLALVNGKPTYEVFYSSNSSWTSISATNRVSLNKWHTLVGTYESGTQKLYLDGTLVASTSSGVGTLVKTSTAPFTIGANPTVRGVEGSYFNGYISDVLAINSSLTSSVVSSYYGSNFNRSYNNANTLFKYTTEGSSYKLKGYNLGYASDGIQLQLDGKNNRGYSRSSSVKTWYDLSNNQNNGTITGTTWGSNYLSFASSSDHVEKTSATYNISSAYTIEIVLRPINQISTYQMIFSTVNTGTGVKQYMSLWSNQANSTYSNASYRIENADGTNHKNSYYAGIEKNTAYTLTAALNGTNIKIYKNGSLVNSETLTFTPRMSESGMYISSSSYPFDGYIYSIRVYNRELSASEISANYQNDKSRFGF